MGKRANKTGRNDQAARHVRLYHWIMKTPAWRDLSAYQVRVYVDIAMRYGGPGSNNGRLHYSAREAAAVLHMGKTTGYLALKGLEDHGFIVCMTKGGFSRKDRHATEWRLTEFPCDVTGAPPTMEFKNWQGTIQNAVRPGELTVRAGEPNGSAQRTVAL